MGEVRQGNMIAHTTKQCSNQTYTIHIHILLFVCYILQNRHNNMSQLKQSHNLAIIMTD